MSSNIFFSVVWFFSCIVYGDLADTPLLGHNLTPTSYVLKKGQVTVGNYAVGYGITDSWMIATSPWLDISYNMPMIDTRYNFIDASGFRLTAEASYFKTFDFGADIYKQQSTFERLVATQNFSSLYSLHAAFGYQYFWDDTRPYSLRLNPGNADLYTQSLSTLHELRWSGHFGTFFEVGVLGLNYDVPYLHLGASIFSKWHWGYIQLGLSRSSLMGSVDSVSLTNCRSYCYQDTIYHPEIQFQWFL